MRQFSSRRILFVTGSIATRSSAAKVVLYEVHLPELVSLVAPFYNEESLVLEFYDRVRAVMDRTGMDWELICVNDGSIDETLDHLLKLQREDARVKVLDLSRNFGKEAALTAGLDHARGDAVIPIDSDLQDPPEVIPDMISRWRDGFHVVNAVRKEREGESWIKKSTSHFFYRTINRISEIPIPQDTGDFRLLSRSALDALKQLPERRRFMKGLFAWIGFRSTSILYRREPRHSGKTKWNYWRLWNFALEGFTSFSQVPLRLASYVGLIVSTCAFIYAAYMVVDTLFYGNPVKGYPSLIVSILFLGGAQLMALGIIGEYLGRIYEETKHRPVYLIAKIYSEETSNRPDNEHPFS